MEHRGLMATQPYRELTELSAAPTLETETAAVAELSRRAGRVRALTLLVCIALGLAFGVVGYLVIRQAQFETIGGQWAWFSALIGMAPPCMVSFWGARHVARALVRLRLPAWLERAERDYGIPAKRLGEYRRLLVR